MRGSGRSPISWEGGKSKPRACPCKGQPVFNSAQLSGPCCLPDFLPTLPANRDSGYNMIRATLAPTGSPGRPPTPPRSPWVPVSRAQLCKAPWRPDVRLRPGIPGGLRGRLECGASVCTEVAELKGGAGHPGGEPCLQSGRQRWGAPRGGGRAPLRSPWVEPRLTRGETPCTGKGAPLRLGPSPSVCASPHHTPLALRLCVSPSALVCLSLAP